MNKQFINEYYNILKSEASLCLYPLMSCSENPIKAHSIQNSKVFEHLHFEGNLIGLKIKPNNTHYPEIVFDTIGRKDASIFRGFCSKHDNELFQEIDIHQFNPSNKKQLFLLAYRSVCKEVHSKLSAAEKVHTFYLSKISKGLIDENSVTPESKLVMQTFDEAYDIFEYKNILDEALMKNDYKALIHEVFEIELEKPKLACSQLFSNDSVIYQDSVSRIIMNIFPVSKHQTLAIFSSTVGEKTILNDYIYKCTNSKDKLRNYEISKIIIRNSENFYINPQHFETWNIEKQNKILSYFQDTLHLDDDKDDLDYYLF